LLQEFRFDLNVLINFSLYFLFSALGWDEC